MPFALSSTQLDTDPIRFSMKAFLRPVVVQVCKVCGSSNQCRQRLFGAVATSDAAKGDRIRRRVTKDDRKSMVESYVNKYRLTNAGKFPTISDARKEVGGSHYTIRKIMQELQHNSKLNSEEHYKKKLLGGTAEDNHVSTSMQEHSASKVSSEHADVLHLNVDRDGHVDKAELSSIKSSHDQISSHQVGTTDHTFGWETEEPQVSDNKLNYAESSSNEVAAKDLADDPWMVKPKTSETSIHDQSSSLDDGLLRDSSIHVSHDTEPQKKPSLWGNLKSFADNFFSMWRKR
ncbi:hypothetical protein Droror1_Dr00007232 [Drosera rotundifolia]